MAYKVKHPYAYACFNVSNGQNRNDTIKARIQKYLDKNRLTHEQFAVIANKLAERYGFKVTKYDINNYLYKGISPKIDKLIAISNTMGMPMSSVAGYGGERRLKTRQRNIVT